MADAKPAILPLSAVRELEFLGYPAEDRYVTVWQGQGNCPFDIRRVFTIHATKNGLIGGRHAHRSCTQLLVALSGSCEVICKDENGKQISKLLAHPTSGVIIPPSIWGEQHYRSDDCVLMVICDEYYDPDDYIRDFDDYARYRRGEG